MVIQLIIFYLLILKDGQYSFRLPTVIGPRYVQNKEDIFNMIIANEKFIKYLEGANIINKIYVPNRLVNFVLK